MAVETEVSCAARQALGEQEVGEALEGAAEDVVVLGRRRAPRPAKVGSSARSTSHDAVYGHITPAPSPRNSDPGP
jgi:hypothetical protein